MDKHLTYWSTTSSPPTPYRINPKLDPPSCSPHINLNFTLIWCMLCNFLTCDEMILLSCRVELTWQCIYGLQMYLVIAIIVISFHEKNTFLLFSKFSVFHRAFVLSPPLWTAPSYCHWAWAGSLSADLRQKHQSTAHPLYNTPSTIQVPLTPDSR